MMGSFQNAGPSVLLLFREGRVCRSLVPKLEGFYFLERRLLHIYLTFLIVLLRGVPASLNSL